MLTRRAKMAADGKDEDSLEKQPMLEDGKDSVRHSGGKPFTSFGGKSPPSQALVAGTCFCLASGGMTLLNKAALSSFNFKAPDALLFYQCLLCVVLVRLFAAFRLIKVEPFNWKIVRVWYPVNIIFVCMIVTSFWALKDLGVPMSTVLKNLTNLIVVSAEYFMYGRVYNKFIWACMGLMVLSGFCGAATDLAFSASGYFWQLVNAIFTASNMLYLKVVMERVKAYTVSGGKLDEFSMVFYNNLLSLPLIAGLMWWQGEWASLPQQPDLYNPAFLVVASLTGVVAFGISFSVLWFLSTTMPTTFSLVGSLNKIPVSIIGLLLFEKSISVPNLLSVLVGLASGVMFVIAKQRSNG